MHTASKLHKVRIFPLRAYMQSVCYPLTWRMTEKKKSGPWGFDSTKGLTAETRDKVNKQVQKEDLTAPRSCLDEYKKRGFRIWSWLPIF